jgi:hypothetical protein
MDKSNLSYKDCPRINVLSWAMTIFVILWCLVFCLALVNSTSTFATLFSILNVQPPLVTRFLLANHKWLYPLLFSATALFVLAKEFVVRDARSRLATTAIVFVATASSLGLVVYVLYLPIFDLVDKLGKSK